MISARCNGCGRIGCGGNNMLCIPHNLTMNYDWTKADKEK